ncbi:hypothetical protein LWI28_012600 [Acer negundo]|uniref:Small multi-drug export protein n=1 Tax=Acer negundo TaxID=4023 RepID=A0AAD5NLN2_ACENE|nr:hypothetical protein LWI28_012600 [Acer negundo]
MAASVSSLTFSFYNTKPRKPHFKTSLNNVNSLITNVKSRPFPTFQNPHHLGPLVSSYVVSKASSSDGFLDKTTNGGDLEILPFTKEGPVKYLLWVLVWTSLSLVWFAASSDANAAAAAATDSIKASSFGQKIATALRSSGWPDQAVVFALATLPIIELRGAIPVGYWMQLRPDLLTILSVLGNMVPVPFIILYLKRFASFIAGKSEAASRFLDMLFERAKEKAGPVEEFQWLGLMLFVAVPFPGTGAWTGAIIASILDMPFWSAVSANFVGVVLAGLLVNLLVNLGLNSAIKPLKAKSTRVTSDTCSAVTATNAPICPHRPPLWARFSTSHPILFLSVPPQQNFGKRHMYTGPHPPSFPLHPCLCCHVALDISRLHLIGDWTTTTGRLIWTSDITTERVSNVSCRVHGSPD